jgi:hypothetical protein
MRFTPWWHLAPVPGFTPGAEAAFVRRGFDLALAVEVDLRGRRSVRLELEAVDPADPLRREAILTNPVYVCGPVTTRST